MNKAEKAQKEQFDQESGRKSEALRITGSVLHKEAWNTIEMHLFDQWGKTKHDQIEDREALHKEMKALRRVKKYYESIISTGSLAEEQLGLLQRAVKRAKKVINT